MSAKHTKGPWSEPRIYKDPANKPYACRIYADGRTICDVDMRTGRDYEANARLIAAAPDLLNMLARLRHEITHNPEWSDLSEQEFAVMLADADAAIAKAQS